MSWLLFLFLGLSINPVHDGVSDEDQLINLQLYGEFNPDHLDELITFMFRSSENIPVLEFQIQNPVENGRTEYMLESTLRSGYYGVLLNSIQSEDTGIVLEAGEVIQFTNLDIIEGKLPGSSNELKFDFSLSSSARNILSALGEGALVADDTYTVEVNLYRKSDGDVSVEAIATDSISFETTLATENLEIRDSDNELNRLSKVDLRFEAPLFQWRGLNDLLYRLIVVKKTDSEMAVKLLSDRFEKPFSSESTSDISENIYLDVQTRSSSYQYPEELLEFLEQGESYAWQVRSNVRTTHGNKEISSEVWDFTTEEIDTNELTELLSILLGSEKVEQLLSEGLELDTIELDGVTYTAGEAVVILREMIQKIKNNKAAIGE
jgi:hypothetical protein